MRLSQSARKLRCRIEDELLAMGWTLEGTRLFPPSPSSKDDIRNLHKAQRVELAQSKLRLVERYGDRLLQEFAEGKEICPEKFSPVLVPVRADSRESDLFRFASLLWAIPIKEGYGRRMRYLIRDSYNDKLIGLIALMDPVFNLTPRDKDINWNSKDRSARLYHVLDANGLGAVPPYDRLLCGKFAALAATSDQVRHDFAMKYRGRETIISKARKKASLVLVTTTSALGRSSIYNRLRLPNESDLVYRSVGYSEGWGHFQITNATFKQIRDWLREIGNSYADGHQFGDGPNWRLRTIRQALDLLGLDGNSLWHGVKREVFVAPLAVNYREFLRGDVNRPTYYHRDFVDIADFFKERWMIPRSQRIVDWREWSRERTWQRIRTNCDLSTNLTPF